jgi:hypothetical protein
VTLGKPRNRLLLYRKWPRNLLNRFSEAKKRKHLFARIPGFSSLDKPFQLPQAFHQVQRIAFIWPNDLMRAFCAFPVVTSLKRAWPHAQELHLTSPAAGDFLRTAFGSETVHLCDLDALRLDDLEYLELITRVSEFHADITFLLEANPSPWFQMAFILGQSALRCHLGEGLDYPFTNLRIQSIPGECLLTQAQKLEPLLQGSGLLPQGMAWARLQPSPSASDSALKILKEARLTPGNLWAYIPGNALTDPSDIAVSHSLRQQEGSLELISLQFQDSENPSLSAGSASQGLTQITITSLAELLGITPWLKGVYGPPSPLLYLLSLSNLEIRTWLNTDQSDLDLSAMNPRFRLLPTQAKLK